MKCPKMLTAIISSKENKIRKVFFFFFLPDFPFLCSYSLNSLSLHNPFPTPSHHLHSQLPVHPSVHSAAVGPGLCPITAILGHALGSFSWALARVSYKRLGTLVFGDGTSTLNNWRAGGSGEVAPWLEGWP